jgi:hypothetical protein
MFIIHFFTGSLLGIISGILLSLLIIAVIFSATTVALMATGGPDPCEPAGGELSITQANSDAFQAKWDALQESLDGGTPGSATFTESEVASRAESWVNDEDAPFEDIRVCLYEDYSEASATLEVLGFDVKFKVKGTLDLSGTSVEADIDDISIGNVPGFMMAPAEAIVGRAIEESLSDQEIEHDYDLEREAGSVTVSGTP